MREIKFRVWIECDKKMLYSDGYFENSLSWLFDSEYTHIMQFTGLKDKNGKEIYEGDIVKYFDSYEEIAKIEMFNYQWSIVNEHHCHTIDWCELEVIGNIYENPELIQGNCEVIGNAYEKE